MLTATQIGGFAGAGLAGALRGYVPVLPPHAHEVSEFRTTHLRERA